jgi:uncharacterized protein (TIGR03437 family)
LRGSTDLFLLRLADLTAPPPALTIVSAASYRGGAVAPDSIAAAFGRAFADSVLLPEAGTLPTILGGLSVELLDAAGSPHQARIFFVSPGQINFLVPAQAAPGHATITIRGPNSLEVSAPVQIAAVAPGIFTAEASGRGVAAALLTRIRKDGSQETQLVFRYDEAQRRIVPEPIEMQRPEDTSMILLLFGTGIRGNSGLHNVSAQIASRIVEALYAGPQGEFNGLDQVNVRFSSEESFDGEQTVQLIADGRAANPVTLTFRRFTPPTPPPAPSPAITALVPPNGRAGTSLDFRVNGTNLAAVTSLSFNPPTGVAISNLQATASSITARVTLANDAPVSLRQVRAIAPAGNSNELTFSVLPRITTPEI